MSLSLNIRCSDQQATKITRGLLRLFRVRELPRATEIERPVVQRVGQDIFRNALIEYWEGRCAVTGLRIEPQGTRADLNTRL
jgi:putative restriction endonuclease